MPKRQCSGVPPHRNAKARFSNDRGDEDAGAHSGAHYPVVGGFFPAGFKLLEEWSHGVLSEPCPA